MIAVHSGKAWNSEMVDSKKVIMMFRSADGYENTGSEVEES
jgi:hypothetical protein